MKAWFSRHFIWFVLFALVGAAVGLDRWHPSWMETPWLGIPRWGYLAIFLYMPMLGFALKRSGWTRAQGAYHALIVILQKPFGRIPVVGDVLTALDAWMAAPPAGPQDPIPITVEHPKSPPPPPPPIRPGDES